MATKTIFKSILNANADALAVQMSSVYDVHRCKFGVRSKAYKDADALAKKLASQYSCDFSIYAVVGMVGWSAHSKSEIVLVAVKSGDELNRCGRVYHKLFSVK